MVILKNLPRVRRESCARGTNTAEEIRVAQSLGRWATLTDQA
jgi:hypothetical protein